MNQLKENGYQFLDFITINDEELECYKPLAGSFAVIQCTGRFLLCYNVWRQQWEIPAGRREESETPKECAIRELYEETGQIVSNMIFKGLVKVQNKTTRAIKFNPVYYAEIEKLQPFVENEETSKILLWDLKEEIGSIDMVDINIFEYL
ncbi:DNA mismatch repair protein MutT [Lottiidibacillus patelloidae]|uniref:DNA mismatch repair protein MutT n=1 Tax=Lottiidibacillus patelloidae TaxID=2670334 RepID=A0A263BV52_9BACI|nr:NUDIX hydrolase [Lottiidibacillus patelloidae]OZM57575.1 DNA mismatch repair protein MutT [Lottiidibacillus patelloidae]